MQGNAGAESPALPGEVGVLLTGSVSLIPSSQGELLRGCAKQSSQICESIPDSSPGAHQLLMKIDIGAMKVIFTPSTKGRVKAPSVLQSAPSGAAWTVLCAQKRSPELLWELGVAEGV